MNAFSIRTATGAFAFCAIGGLSALPAMMAQAQSASTADAAYEVTDADRAAAQGAVRVTPHALPVRPSEGQAARKIPVRAGHRVGAAAAPAAGATSSSAQLRYPADLSFQGGPTIQAAQHHAIYLRPNGHCPVSSCWGDPERFLGDLSRSDFIHVTDQYTGRTDSNRYPVGKRAFASFKPPFNFSPNAVPFTDNDMLALIHAVAAKTGNTGYGHLYHVFLPQGTDECFDNTYSVCYSPDNPSTFFFCAYHGYADFNDIGHVLYSVEPYQNLQGCQVAPNTPNGELVDSTNDVLSHETFEAITDPDLDAWWNNGGNQIEGGAEIGDECVFLLFIGNNVYSDPGIFSVGERNYAAQPEYDNASHACAMAP